MLQLNSLHVSAHWTAVRTREQGVLGIGEPKFLAGIAQTPGPDCEKLVELGQLVLIKAVVQFKTQCPKDVISLEAVREAFEGGQS